MDYLFKKDIYDWNCWGEVFQSIDDFRELIKEIFVKENLFGHEKISNLTPGTNAVFKVGDYVIKIFAPKESGANTEVDYNVELESMERAIRKGINTPNIIVASSIEDKYLFRYIIMEYLNGEEAGKRLKSYSHNEKIDFVNKLKENLRNFNVKPIENIDGNLIVERVLNNKRWNNYSKDIRNQIHKFLKDYRVSQCVYVHGDITSDNVMVDNQNNLFIIDFADSTIAPIEYEWVPIIFDLFNFDKELIKEFIKDMDYNVFVERLFKGVLLHEFGAYFVKIIYEKYSGTNVAELTDINEIKELIFSNLI